MTGYDQKLGWTDFSESSPQLTLYRLARSRYANLSGVGAAAQPGRWNHTGQEALYTSTDVATPVLEKLVHTPKEVIPSNLSLLTIHVVGYWKADIQEGFLTWPHTDFAIAVFDTLGKAEQYFHASAARRISRGREIFGFAVPSVIVPRWNVILYPEARGFREHVRMASVEPFEFDPRLFPEGVTKEP